MGHNPGYINLNRLLPAFFIVQDTIILDNIAPFYHIKWAGVKRFRVGVYPVLYLYHDMAPFYHIAATRVKCFLVGVYPVWLKNNGSTEVSTNWGGLHQIGASTDLGRT